MNYDEWALDMRKYAIYCKECARDRWNTNIQLFVKNIDYYDDAFFAAKVRAFTFAGEVMMELNKGASMEVIKEFFELNIKDLVEVALVGEIMLDYSDAGLSFVEQVLDMTTLRLLANLVKKYDVKRENEMLKRFNL